MLFRSEAVVKRIKPLGWHLQVHLDAQDILKYRDFLLGLDIVFIIDHMGRVVAKNGLDQQPFKLMLDLMKDQRVWTKVSGFERVSSTGKPFRDAMPYARALVEAAPDRVLWGTDYPHPNVKEMPNDGEQVDLFAETITDEAMRKRILVDNPTKLYWS
mgnify:FL=1